MSRPFRIEFPGAVYHVSSRGNNHQPIVLNDQDRFLFLALLAKAAEQFSLEILAFCLMDNHYHLFLRTPKPNLHLALQWLGANYTRAFNRRHQRDGHLFKGRYHAVLVDDHAHWLHLSAYIHLNPVRAGLVDDPASWPWSSARDYLSTHPRHWWLDPEPLLASYGETPMERRQRYRRHLSDLCGAPNSTWNDLREAFFVGSAERWEEMKLSHPPVGRRRELTKYQVKGESQVDPVDGLSRLALALDTTVPEIMARRSKLRPAAFYFLVRECGMTGAQVAEIFEVSSMAVSLGLRKFENAPDKVSELKFKVRKL